MNTIWFKRTEIFFVPVSLMGWLLLSGALAYAVYIFIAIDRRSHSVSDTLMNFAFNLLLIGAVYVLVAFFTSKKKQASSGD
ncbi:MAG: hypothetical protein KDC28_16120 [Saprospiraceae bacterium]|nr:hypothetical protein [Saprospiraceae bacterium]MCB9321876.1 hypothetical protein [Lewinellaceae bacterium]